MKKLIEALDPGLTTGWALLELDDKHPMELFDCGQIKDGVEGVLARKFLDIDILISEQFVLDGRTVKPELEPLRIEGVLMAEAYGLGHQLIFQRNNFKKHVDDAKLKEIGWYQKGMPHANDAIRHALAWAKLNHRPTLETYWSKIEEC